MVKLAWVKDHEPRHDQSQSGSEAGQGFRGFPAQQTEHVPQRGNAAKQSRISDRTITFVQHTFASGADDRLDERRRTFLAHVVTKPYLTLKDLALFAGVGTEEGARQLWDSSLKALWQASPPELQQQYPLVDLSRRIRRGSQRGPHTPEHRARLSAANKAKKLSPEARAKISAANKGKKRSPEARAKISAANKGKQFSPETRALISEGLRKSWHRRKQEENIQIFPPSPKT